MNSIRRRLPLALAGASLILTAAAAAAPSSFTVAWSPSHVKPTTSATYTVSLTNSASSDPKGADRATISADGFQVVGLPTASVRQSGTPCATTPSWTAEVAPDGHTITATRTSGPNTNNVCPGGTLTVVFTATSPAGPDGPYQWPTGMFRGDEAFTGGPSPTVVVDGVPPQTAITSDPPSLTNSASASFTFSSEAGSSFECSLDGALFSPCASPKEYRDLSDGGHAFAVRAVDQASNTGPASSRNWTIDTRPPAAAVSSGPAALSNRRSAAFAFSADEGSSFVCALDGGAFQPCTSPTSYDGLGDGAHTFAMNAMDAVGNVGVAASYAWAVDATAPETALASAPRSGTASTSASFTFQANERVSFECQLDGAAFAPCSAPKSYARLSRARHTFAVRAIDAAGNIEPTPATHSWAITAAPRTVKKASALFAPEAGARVRTPPRLAWRPLARALYYNVQLYRGKTKVLTAWPTRPRLQLRARWTYLGRQRKLSPGRYRWYVWPAFRNNGYGRLLGQSTFIVTSG